MRNKYIFLCAVLLFICVSSVNVFAENDEDYQKYGRIAMAVVKEDYPGQDVVEYQYLGRRKLEESKVVDSFRFEDKKNDRIVFVHVRVLHDLKDKKSLSLMLEEKEQ